MRRRRALFYLTFNGVHQNTNGIGRQTATMVGTVDRRWSDISGEFGPAAFSVLTPAPYNRDLWGISVDAACHVESVARGTGGTLFSVPVADDAIWIVETWQQLCAASAERVEASLAAYDEILVLAVDAPFLQVDTALERRIGSGRVIIVHCPYSSYALTATLEPHAEREAWERAAFESFRMLEGSVVGDVSRFMTRHLAATYALPPSKFVPFESSVDLFSPDFELDAEATVAATLDRYGVPRDRPLALAFGRAHPIKGFDILLRALREFPERRLHVILVVVPYPGDSGFIEELRALAGETELEVTIVAGYDRVLPRAAAQWTGTRVVCCPSRLDTLPNVPLEVALWARRGGPVVVASDAGGIPECVEDGRTGYLFASGDADALRRLLLAIVNTPPGAFGAMRAAAYEKVVRERDQYDNLTRLLRRVWACDSS